MAEPVRHASWSRDHLANERTLLAWLRTALAFMAFGMALAKLGVLLRVATVDHPEMAAQLPGGAVTEALGAGLVALGGVVGMLGTVRTWRWAREIDPTGPMPQRLSLLATSALTVGLGVALVLYLLL